MAKAHPFTLRLYRLCVVLHEYITVLGSEILRSASSSCFFVLFFRRMLHVFPEMMAFLPQSLFFWFLPDKLSNDA